MSDIYINEATGKKIKVYRETMVHVYDHEDPSDILDFRDTAEGVAQWCVESGVYPEENLLEIEEEMEQGRWLNVIKLTNCKYCKYDVEWEWVVEEVA